MKGKNIKIKKLKNKKNNAPPCNLCHGKCCSYFAFEIDKPTKISDFDNLRWYLLHEKTFIFVESGDWFLQINTPCKHLTSKFTCSIYKKRPNVCRDYGLDDESGEVLCDHITDDVKHDMEFHSDKDIELYVKKRFPNVKQKR